jgi:hypothetical protein
LETPRCGESHRRASDAWLSQGVDVNISINVFSVTVDDVFAVELVIVL